MLPPLREIQGGWHLWNPILNPGRMGAERASSISLGWTPLPPGKLPAHPAQPRLPFHKRDPPGTRLLGAGLPRGLFRGWATGLFRRERMQPRDRTRLVRPPRERGASLRKATATSRTHRLNCRAGPWVTRKQTAAALCAAPSGCFSKPDSQATAGHRHPEGRRKSLVAGPTRFLGAGILG